MARPRKTTTESGTYAQRVTAANDEFRKQLRPSLEQEAKDTARRLPNNDQFRKEQTKVALADVKSSRP